MRVLVTDTKSGTSHRFGSPEAFQSWLAHHPQSAGVLRVVNVGICDGGAALSSPVASPSERPSVSVSRRSLERAADGRSAYSNVKGHSA